MACDQPGVRSEHLRALVAEPERVTGSRYAGRTGVPAYFPAASFEALLGLTGDAGAREMLRSAAFVEDEALALDVDTEADVEQARRLAEG
jgi:CTP:molybdopterin cytidylyltransferase MocA